MRRISLQSVRLAEGSLLILTRRGAEDAEETNCTADFC